MRARTGADPTARLDGEQRLRTLRPALNAQALNNRILMALILAAAAVGAAACASDSPRPPKRDPHLDPTLFISPAGKPFHAEPGQPYPVRVWFAEADRNHDGKITREEFRADFQAFFNQIDLNHDDVVDGLEISAYEETVAPEILPRLAQMQAPDARVYPDDPGQLPEPRRPRREPRQLAQAPERKGMAFDGAPEFSLINVSEPVASADLNFDGKVSLEEFLGAADRRFDALDKDRLGYLTLAGLPRTPEQVALEGKKPKG
jgi:hypothetical protein